MTCGECVHLKINERKTRGLCVCPRPKLPIWQVLFYIPYSPYLDHDATDCPCYKRKEKPYHKEGDFYREDDDL
jgi:hypothetical protein